MPSRAAPGLSQQRFRPVAWLGTLAVGCTAILDIDHDYVVEGAEGSGGGGRSATGGQSSGGLGGGPMDASSTGGTSTGGMGIDGAVTGGTSGAGGALPTCSDGDSCGSGEICCSGSCVAPSPEVGCSTACMPCPDPIPNAEPLCAGPVCSARCMTGFVPVPGACVPEGTVDSGSGGGAGDGGSGGGSGAGGVGGASGTGGAPTMCDPRRCPLCINPALGIVPCCDRFTNQCGCSWFSVVYCVE